MAIKIAGNRVLDYDGSGGSNTNIAVGHLALTSTAGGLNNTAVGTQALYSNITGANNLAVGYQSLYNNDGNNNTAVGKSALYDLTTGTFNTILGCNTGLGITTGEKNTIIGANVTGLSSALSNTIILADGDGNQRLRILSSGLVGIGTTSPAERLDVAGAVRISSNAATFTSAATIIDRSGAESRICAGGATDANLSLFTSQTSLGGAAERLRITSTGNVGIGTTTPGSKLQVSTDSASYGETSAPFTIRGVTDSNKILALGFHTTDNVGWIQSTQYGTAVKPLVLQPLGGNVGIGTASPQSILDSRGEARLGSTTVNQGLRIVEAGGVTYLQAGNANTAADLSISPWFTATPSLYVKAAGNVGIGTTSPTSPLQIQSLTTAGSLAFIIAGESNAERMAIRSSGATGGTPVVLLTGSRGTQASPTATQSGDVLGYYQFGGYNATSYFRSAWIYGLASENYTAIANGSHIVISTTANGSTTPSERMRIDKDGNVGIGTASPGQKLHVVGTIYATNGIAVAVDTLVNLNAGDTNSTIKSNSVSGFMEYAGYSGHKFNTTSGGTNTRVTIDSTGNVGIGTASPSWQTQVYGTGQNTALLTDAGSKSGSLFVGSSNGTTGAGGALLLGGITANGVTSQWAIKSLITSTTANGTADLAFSTRALTGDTTLTERLRILSNGRVGINTSAPANIFTVLDSGSLNTAGDTIDVGATVVGPNYAFGIGGNAANFNVHSNTTLGADVGATIGLGGRYTGTQFSQFAIIKGAKENATDGNYATYLAFGTRANGGNIAERMRITSGGNVGIGTTATDNGVLTVAGSNGYAETGINAQWVARFSGSANNAIRLDTKSVTNASGYVRGIYWAYGNDDFNLVRFANNPANSRIVDFSVGSNGNVGIGTASPAQMLQVGSTTNRGQVQVISNDSQGFIVQTGGGSGGSGAAISFYDADTSYAAKISTSKSATNSASLVFSTANGSAAFGERMRIDPSGNVGIGTTSPLQRLAVSAVGGLPATSGTTQNGIARFESTATNTLDIGASAISPYGVWMQGANVGGLGTTYPLLLNPNGGNVGIGTTSPDGKLSVVGGRSFFNAASEPYGVGARYISTGGTVYFGATNGTATPDAQISSAGGGALMTLQNGGNVGIGTASPSTKLQVGVKVADDNGYSHDTNAIYAVHQTATATATLNDPKEILLLARQGTGGQAFGAAASFRLSRFENSGVSARTRLDLVLAHDSFLLTPTTVLTALSSGNVGIGTTSPGAKLHVVGTVMIDQVSAEANLYMGGSTSGNGGKITYDNNNINLKFSLSGSEKMRLDNDNNLKVGGSAARATTAGTNQVVIYNGTAPVGTLANGCSFFSTAGEMRVMDAAGNWTQISPHDRKTNEWIYNSVHTPSGKGLKINVEKLLRFVNDHFGLDCVHDLTEEA